jgi:hypothetical protein
LLHPSQNSDTSINNRECKAIGICAMSIYMETAILPTVQKVDVTYERYHPTAWGEGASHSRRTSARLTLSETSILASPYDTHAAKFTCSADPYLRLQFKSVAIVGCTLWLHTYTQQRIVSLILGSRKHSPNARAVSTYELRYRRPPSCLAGGAHVASEQRSPTT